MPLPAPDATRESTRVGGVAPKLTAENLSQSPSPAVPTNAPPDAEASSAMPVPEPASQDSASIVEYAERPAGLGLGDVLGDAVGLGVGVIVPPGEGEGEGEGGGDGGGLEESPADVASVCAATVSVTPSEYVTVRMPSVAFHAT